MRYLTNKLTRLVVIDSKGSLNDPAWNLEPWSQENVKKLEDGKFARLRVIHPLDGNYEPLFEHLYDIGDLTVYIDEMYAVAPRGRFGNHLNALYTRGRELGIGVWASTQRPSWVPLTMLSEAEWVFTFRLQLANDRMRVAGIVGPDVLEPIPDKFGFWLYNTEWDDPYYCPRLIYTRELAHAT